jgi:hypothetical protein
VEHLFAIQSSDTNGQDKLYLVQNQSENNADSTGKHNRQDDLIFESFSNCMLLPRDLHTDIDQIVPHTSDVDD